MGPLANGVSASITFLRANGWDNASIRLFILSKVAAHNKAANPNPHKITFRELNAYLDTQGVSPHFTGNLDDPVS